MARFNPATTNSVVTVQSRVKEYNYSRKKRLITKSELRFFHTLLKVVNGFYYVVPQVCLPALLEYKIKGQNWKGAFSRIARKSVDYAICCRKKLVPVCAIELDDPSHNRPDRQERDRLVERIFAKVKLPLLRIPTSKQDDEAHLRALLSTVKIPPEAQP